MIHDIFSEAAGEAPKSMSFLQQLLTADWRSTEGPMRINGELREEEISQVELVVNAKRFLTALGESETGIRATVAGNLNREFVGQMLDRLQISRAERESIRTMCKVVNEDDIHWLPLLRWLAQSAGYVRLRKGRFRLTRSGAESYHR